MSGTIPIAFLFHFNLYLFVGCLGPKAVVPAGQNPSLALCLDPPQEFLELLPVCGGLEARSWPESKLGSVQESTPTFSSTFVLATADSVIKGLCALLMVALPSLGRPMSQDPGSS